MSGSGIVAGVFFVVIAIPVAVTLDVAMGAFAFWIPFFVIPVIWVMGMIRCYRRHPSMKLMAALAAAGMLVYTLVPIAIIFVVLATIGDWSAK